MAHKALTSGNTAFKLIMIAQPPGTTRGFKQKNVGGERLVQDNAKSCSVGFLRVVLAFGPQAPMKNYFTSSDPHHDMLGGGCQVRVVIENMMGRMENLRTLISGFLGLVILVRWALVTMFLS